MHRPKPATLLDSRFSIDINGVTTLTQTNQYNGADQRIKKTETAGTNPADVVNYFYQDGKVLYTTGSDANKAFNILGAGDNIIATEHQDTNGNASYSFYNKDLRGSTTNILGSDLTAKVSYDYDWFGNTEISNPAGSDFYNQICYTGGIYDESTKQYYLNARYYDPEDGRFISQDTYRGNLRDANSWNLYAYCANNPVKYSDPSGHFIWFAIGAAFAIYDGVKAYQKAKKQGKSGIKAVAAVAGGIAVGAVFGKVTKALTATKTVAKVAQKVFKSKTVKKLETKIANKLYTGAPKKLTASSTAKLQKKTVTASTGGCGTAFRYVSESELKVIKRTGTIPNTDRAGNLKDVFISPGKYETVADAEKALQIGKQNPFGATGSPTHRIEFNVNGIKFKYGGNVEGGTGIEMITEQSIPVDLTKIFKLR